MDTFTVNSSTIVVSDPNDEIPELIINVLNGQWIGTAYTKFLPLLIARHEAYELNGVWEKIRVIDNQGNGVMGIYDGQRYHDANVIGDYTNHKYSSCDGHWLAMIFGKLDNHPRGVIYHMVM